MSCLEQALAWWGEGVVPLPLRPRSKRPAFPWIRYQTVRPPRPLVRRWFSDRPSANLGLLCGAISGGLVVLDFDSHAEYRGWAAEWPGAARSFSVLTARGRHVYLRVKDAPGRTLAMQGGEVKGSGYVVAPPSVHESGHVYEVTRAAHGILTVESLESVGIEAQPPPTRPVVLGERMRTSSGEGLIDDIKNYLPLTHYLAGITHLQRSSPDGVWLMADCPLHNAKTPPSMWVNTRWQGCRCFNPTCPGNAHVMDVIDLHAALHSLTVQEAVWDLAAEIGL